MNRKETAYCQNGFIFLCPTEVLLLHSVTEEACRGGGWIALLLPSLTLPKPSHRTPSAIIVGEIVGAGLLWHGGRGLGNGDVLQVQEAELHLHADECVKVAACEVAAHLPTQQRAQPVDPDAVLRHRNAVKVTTPYNTPIHSNTTLTYLVFNKWPLLVRQTVTLTL